MVGFRETECQHGTVCIKLSGPCMDMKDFDCCLWSRKCFFFACQRSFARGPALCRRPQKIRDGGTGQCPSGSGSQQQWQRLWQSTRMTLSASLRCSTFLTGSGQLARSAAVVSSPKIGSCTVYVSVPVCYACRLCLSAHDDRPYMIYTLTMSNLQSAISATKPNHCSKVYKCSKCCDQQ